MGTYRVDMFLCQSEIRYLLSEPVTCPIYVVSRGIPKDSPQLMTLLETWLCLPHLVLMSQSVIRSLLGYTHHVVVRSRMPHWIGLILAPAARQSRDFDAFNTSLHHAWTESLTASHIMFLFTGMIDVCPTAHSLIRTHRSHQGVYIFILCLISMHFPQVLCKAGCCCIPIILCSCFL